MLFVGNRVGLHIDGSRHIRSRKRHLYGPFLGVDASDTAVEHQCHGCYMFHAIDLLPLVRTETSSKSGHVLVCYFVPTRENGLNSGGSSAESTGLLQAWSSGDEEALDRLAEQVYPELRL